MLRVVVLSSLFSCIGGCPLSCCLSPEQVQKQQQQATQAQKAPQEQPPANAFPADKKS